MNKNIYNFIKILLFVILLYSLWYIIKKTMIDLGLPRTNRYKETFIPKIIKETYRPIERNIRNNFEGFYDKSSTDISNLFRKFGIL